MAPTSSVTHLDASPRRTEKIYSQPRWTRLEVRGVWAASKGGLEGVDGEVERDRKAAGTFRDLVSNILDAGAAKALRF